MDPIRITKLLAFVQAALVAAAIYLDSLLGDDFLVFALTALPPFLAAWIGAKLATGRAAVRLLLAGQAFGVTAYALAFFAVVSSNEPLAPLLLILVGFWQAVGLAVLLLVVWLVSRRRRGAV